MYRDAFSRLESFALAVARNQFEIFKSLGILPKTVAALEPIFAARVEPPQPAVRPRALLFTGHRIDHPGRPGKTFYGCNRWPDCNFHAWGKPSPKNARSAAAPT